MNPFKALRYYFIGGALAKTDDVFEQVKAEVLFNFTAIFLVTNIPYLFIITISAFHWFMAVSTLTALLMVLIVIKITSNVRKATYFFLANFLFQLGGHYVIDSGEAPRQAVLYFLLFGMSGYLLMDRRWGFWISFGIIVLYSLGVYNSLTNYSLFLFPPELADPPEIGPFRYLAIIPLVLNAYLISEFVRAKQKAEKQLSDQKQMIEEKQKEILDSIRYAKRIQKNHMPTDKHFEKEIRRLKRKI